MRTQVRQPTHFSASTWAIAPPAVREGRGSRGGGGGGGGRGAPPAGACSVAGRAPPLPPRLDLWRRLGLVADEEHARLARLGVQPLLEAVGPQVAVEHGDARRRPGALARQRLAPRGRAPEPA